MKSKEEIEGLAIKHAHLKPNFDRVEEEYYNIGAINAYESFIKGYTQCQEDMADKKYTEEDMRELYAYAKTPDVVFYKKNGSKELHSTDLENYLKIINKQDLPIINGSYGCTIETSKNKQN